MTNAFHNNTFLVFGVEDAGGLGWYPNHQVGVLGGLVGQPDPRRQVQIQGRQLCQHPLGLGLSVGELSKPLADGNKGLVIQKIGLVLYHNNS